MATASPVDVTLMRQLGPHKFEVSMANGGSDAVLHVADRLGAHVAKCTSVTLTSYDMKWTDGCLHLHVNVDDGHFVLLHPSTARGPFRVAELFGGISGWSHASALVDTAPIAIVELDKAACDVCAAAHRTEVLTPQQFYEYALDGRVPKTVVVHGSVTDMMIWAALSLLNVTVLLISPPCQPWSTTGTMGGLNTNDGEVFAVVLENGGLAKIHAIAAENVPGLVRHADFPTLTARAALKGMVYICGELISCQRALPVSRSRWLGSFIHASMSPDTSLIMSAKSVSGGPDKSQSMLPGPSLKEADAVHVNMSLFEINALTPCEDAMAMMRRSDMIPSWLKDKVDWTKDDPVLFARTIHGHQKMSGVMARYGEQHTLPLSHLLDKGIHMVVFHDEIRVRLFSPWEVLAALGFPTNTVISCNSHDAFQQVGNAISPYHAMMQIVRTHVLLGEFSPFRIHESFDDLVQKIAMNSIKLSQWATVAEDDKWMLVPVKPRIQAGSGGGEPDPKRPKVADEIPQTLAFEAAQQVIATRHMAHEPAFELPSLASHSEPNGCVQGGILKLIHSQKHWMTMVHGATSETLSVLVQRALPHACEKHFIRFYDECCDFSWNQQIQCVPEKVIHFEPDQLEFQCIPDSGVTITMHGDVTWTVSKGGSECHLRSAFQ